MPFQVAKLEAPTISKAYAKVYVKGCGHNIWLYVVQYLDFRVLKFQSIIRLNTSPAFDPIFHQQQQQHLIQVDRLWCMFELAAFLCPGENLERCESGMGQQLIGFQHPQLPAILA